MSGVVDDEDVVELEGFAVGHDAGAQEDDDVKVEGDHRHCGYG